MSNLTPRRISLHNANVTKIVFLYDNGRAYNATKIRNVKFNDKDIDGVECVNYSRYNGNISIIHKEDLAAITVHYKNGIISTQKLMPCAITRASARVHKKQKLIRTISEFQNSGCVAC